MDELLNRKNILIIITGVVAALIIAGFALAALYFFDRDGPDPFLEQSIKNEYSVQVEVKSINTSGQFIPYIVPGKVKWNPEQKELLYNLSNPKEAALAVVETLTNNDVDALDLLMSQATKDYWLRNGYEKTRIIEEYRSYFSDIDKPYIFGLDESELTSESMIVLIRSVSRENQFELTLQPDGTWKL